MLRLLAFREYSSGGAEVIHDAGEMKPKEGVEMEEEEPRNIGETTRL
jgi:hypothetical protein